MAGWENLPHDLLVSIAEKISVMEDFVMFGAVCLSWQHAAHKRNFKAVPRFPWLMLADKKYTKKREFYSHPNNHTYRFLLPQVKAKRCLSSKGWIFTVGKDWEVRLVHPISRHEIILPSINTFKHSVDFEVVCPWHVYGLFFSKFVLSENPSMTKNYIVMVVYGLRDELAIWRPGDKTWTPIVGWRHLWDISYYKNQLFAIDTRGTIIACDIKGPHTPNFQLVTVMPEGLIDLRNTNFYLVDSLGDLWVVSRHMDCDGDGPQLTQEFQVYKVNANDGGWIRMNDLGERAIFIGCNSPFSLDANRCHGCKANCIYYTEDRCDFYFSKIEGGGKDMGIYHLQDGSIEMHFKGRSLSHFSPPLWLEPSFF